MPIRVLPPQLVREIAAGEVITRPTDVVKELVENALDAGATRIEVRLARGGLEGIRVSDNGAGISEHEVALAVARHATSKLEQPASGNHNPLGQIESLGFRGEALWSIGFAAELTLLTRPSSQLGGVRLVAANLGQPNERLETEASAAASGTTVTVRQLFANLPARRHSLDTPAQEARRVLHLISRYVLHHPQVGWQVLFDDEMRLAHTPAGSREAAATVYGPVVANRLLPIAWHDDDGYALGGVISRPELARKGRDRLSLAVNGRPVEFDEALAGSVLRAYSTLLPRGHAPVAILNLTVPAKMLNVNTHPSKARVGFLAQERILEALFEAVSQALLEHPLVRPAPEPRLVTGPVRQSGSAFPPLRHLGQFRASYLLAEGDGDLWLLDQHAAHERILFEELEDAFAQSVALDLPEPELVTLTPAQALALAAREPELRAWGLVLEAFDASGQLWRVRSLPAALVGLPVPDLVRDLVGHALGPEQAKTSVLARFACHPAVKAGHHLAEAEAQALLDALRACRIPWACPHGRPTALRLTERDLAHQFGRRSVRDVARWGDERDESQSEKVGG
jgi:DNA mismatch repair protein MutL